MNETIVQDITPEAQNKTVEVNSTIVSAAMLAMMVVGTYTTAKFVAGKVIDRKVNRKIKQQQKEAKKNKKNEK